MAAPADAPLRLPHLPVDIIVEILFRVGGAVAVVRCAATCKAWRRLILEPSFLSRRRVGSSSLLRFFFKDTSQNLSGFSAVASGAGGLLALRRAQGSSCDPIRIYVCDPMAGTSTFLPPLAPTLFRESLVFLDADGSSFRLVAAVEMNMGHPANILLRVFSSRTGQWGTTLTAQPPDNLVVLLGCPAVIHHGAVHWICETRAHPYTVHALAVRLGGSARPRRRRAESTFRCKQATRQGQFAYPVQLRGVSPWFF
ncbi:hypothetical protein ACQ4PT_053397 [Festuca glaucescens]